MEHNRGLSPKKLLVNLYSRLKSCAKFSIQRDNSEYEDFFTFRNSQLYKKDFLKKRLNMIYRGKEKYVVKVRRLKNSFTYLIITENSTLLEVKIKGGKRVKSFIVTEIDLGFKLNSKQISIILSSPVLNDKRPLELYSNLIMEWKMIEIALTN